jgi:hypothetical protein
MISDDEKKPVTLGVSVVVPPLPVPLPPAPLPLPSLPISGLPPKRKQHRRRKIKNWQDVSLPSSSSEQSTFAQSCRETLLKDLIARRKKYTAPLISHPFPNGMVPGVSVTNAPVDANNLHNTLIIPTDSFGTLLPYPSLSIVCPFHSEEKTSSSIIIRSTEITDLMCNPFHPLAWIPCCKKCHDDADLGDSSWIVWAHESKNVTKMKSIVKKSKPKKKTPKKKVSQDKVKIKAESKDKSKDKKKDRTKKPLAKRAKI